MITAGTDPGVTFDWDFFPFMDTLQQAVGGTAAIALVVAVAVLVLSALAWGIGKLSGSRGMQGVGATAFLVAAGVCVLIGAANGVARWGSGIDTGF